MDSDKLEKIEQVKTFEGTRPDNEETKKNSHVDTEECEERSERCSRNRTEKGFQFDLEIGIKRKEGAAKDVRSRKDATYESLREPEDLVKLGLEAELNNFNSIHENVTDLLIRLGLNEREQKEHDEYVVSKNAALECLADVKVRIKD